MLIKKTNIYDKGTIDLKHNITPVSKKKYIESESQMDYAPLESHETDTHLIEDADRQADEIINAANDEAQRIIEEANASQDELKMKAVEDGIEEGKKIGEEQINESISSAFETLNNAIKERKKIIKDSEPEIARLSLKIAEEIIRREVGQDKEIIMNIIIDALSKISDRENVIIRVNNDDSEYIKKNKDKISGMLDGIKNISIMEDLNIESGGCVIETNLGYIDARINTRLALIESAMKKVENSSESK